MRIIETYIIKHLVITTVVVSFALLSIDLFFSLVNEIRFIGKGGYELINVLEFVALTVPRKIYTMFPWSAMLGSLIGLGALAKTSELIIIQAMGYSVQRISVIVIEAALILTIIAFGMGELIAPHTERFAENRKTLAISQGSTIHTQHGIWIRNNNDFVHINKVSHDKILNDLTIYKLGDNLQLQQVVNAQSATWQSNQWLVTNITGTIISTNGTSVFKQDDFSLPSFVNTDIIEFSAVKHLDRLSLQNLHQAIKQRLNNELNAKDYQLAFWSKVFKPFAIIIMVYLAIPFIYGPLRNSSLGLKILVGALVGFIFHTLNEVFAHLAIVLELPPVIAAAIPTVTFFIFGAWMMNRVRQ